MRRVLFGVGGGLLILPLSLLDGSGDQLGLGLFVAFIGLPVGLTCLAYAAWNIQEPTGTHGPVVFE